jgi:cytoskeleton protein RodZ
MSDEALGTESIGDSTTAVGNGAGDSGVAALPPTAFGARLLWERERAGLSQPDVAARLRLHPNQVRALEQETLAVLPEAAYVRGFVRSYARILYIVPAMLLHDIAAKFCATDGSVVDRMVSL